MMNTVRRLAIAVTLVAASTATAFAQPGVEIPVGSEETPPPPPPDGTIVTVTPQAQPGQPAQPQVMAVVAPYNTPWSNVNHINGQLVKVGEKGEYLIAHKKTNISTNPIGWMFGFYGLSLSHAVNSNMAIRGDANLFNIDDESGYEFGVSLPIYFRRVYSGPFIEPGLVIRDFDTDDNCYDYDYCDDSSKSIGPEVLFGWHWTFDSGANVAFAFGAHRPMNRDNEYGDDVEPAGYFRIGYAY
jgi:hypothetical protein